MKTILIFVVGLVLGIAIRPLFENSGNSVAQSDAQDHVSLHLAAPIRQGKDVRQDQGVIQPQNSEGAERGYPIVVPRSE